jgi:serine/threonine protein kinase
MNKKPICGFRKYYDNLEVIGKGAFGIVYKGRNKKSNKFRAIKVIQLDILKENILSNIEENEDPEKKFEEYIENYINECENMKICSNINSVKFYRYFKDEKEFVIIMELCDCNLSQLLLEKNKEGFNEDEIYEIMTQLNNGLKIMKENNIIHRDLKLENILIKYKDNNNKIIKLADYGSSKRLDPLYQNYCYTNAGTLKYTAPEILMEEKHNHKCDLWSIGVIIYRLKFVKFPLKGDIQFALINNINNFNNNNIKKTGNKELDDLIKRLLEKDYHKRIDWEEYFNHPFFKNKYNEINLIYYAKKDGVNDIFGYKFVENNKNNIELVINGKKN